jgi:hypothetical protein
MFVVYRRRVCTLLVNTKAQDDTEQQIGALLYRRETKSRIRDQLIAETS